MSYDEKQEESRHAYNNWLDQQRYRRQDEQWRQSRLTADQQQANEDIRQGDLYLSIYRRAGYAAAEAFAKKAQELKDNNTATISAYYDRAKKAFNEGNYGAAINDLNVCLSYKDNIPDFYSFRGTCFQHLQRYREAETDYTAVINLNTQAGYKGGYYYFLRGECRLELGEFADAIKDFTIAELLLPNDGWLNQDVSLRAQIYADLHYDRGCSQYYTGNFTSAKDDFGACIQIFPNWDEPYIWRARAQRELQESEEAIYDYSVVLSRNPIAYIYRERAWAYSSIADYASAIEDLDKVIQLDQLPGDFADRGWKYLLLGGRDDQALSDFDEAIALGDHSSNTFNGRGLVHLYKKNFYQALDDFDAAIKLDPTNSFAYKNRGRVRYDQGEYELAIADQEEAARIDPSNPNTFVDLGEIYLKIGRNDSAKQVLLKAEELFLEQKRYEKSVEVAQRILRI